MHTVTNRHWEANVGSLAHSTKWHNTTTVIITTTTAPKKNITWPLFTKVQFMICREHSLPQKLDVSYVHQHSWTKFKINILGIAKQAGEKASMPSLLTMMGKALKISELRTLHRFKVKGVCNWALVQMMWFIIVMLKDQNNRRKQWAAQLNQVASLSSQPSAMKSHWNRQNVREIKDIQIKQFEMHEPDV